MKKPNPAVYNTASKINKDLRSLSNRCVLDIETTGLNPWESKLVCIGVMDTETKKVVTFYHENEEEMLKVFLDYFSRKQFNEVIGYNVLFDARFLFGKCLRYELQANRFFSVIFTDLMWTMKSVIKKYSFNRPGTLQEWIEFLFDDGKMPLSDSIENLSRMEHEF